MKLSKQLVILVLIVGAGYFLAPFVPLSSTDRTLASPPPAPPTPALNSESVGPNIADTDAPSMPALQYENITSKSTPSVARPASNAPKQEPVVANASSPTGKFIYYPSYASDENFGSIPHSLNKAPRFSAEQMQEIRSSALESAPGLKILKNLGHDYAAIIPLQGLEGRFLHLTLLDNNSIAADTKGRSHISGIYFAKANGEILPHQSYSIVNEGNLHPYYGQDPASMMLNGNNERFWRPADGRKFPYHFSVDCKSKQEADYLVIARRAPTGWLPFFRNFELELSDKAEADPSKSIKLNANNYGTNKAAEEKLQGKPLVATSDATGVVPLRHYNATKLNQSMLWNLWLPKSTSYQAFIRLKNPELPVTGKFTFNFRSGKISDNTFSSLLTSTRAMGYSLEITAEAEMLDNILAIELVPKLARPAYLAQTKATGSNPVVPDLSKIHPEIVSKMEKVAQGHYDIRTTVPEMMEAGTNGYLIITTEQKLQSLTSIDAFIRHKQSKGFNVQILTEKDYGGGTGQDAALNIRKWLQQNYQKRKLLYALFLGNPHPKLGDTPYKLVGDKLWPTDYFYVDLSGDWDKNKNGIYADNGDYGEGGINGQPNIYVGRIPFYGVDAGIGNARHVDAILERVIRYENQAGDLAWRHNIYYAGDTFERTQNFYYEFLAHNGAKMTRHTHSPNLLYSPDVDHYRQHSTIESQNAGQYGFVYYQEHGSPWGIGMMSTGGAEQLSDKVPAVYALGGCDVASPEHPDNVSFALLRNNAVAVYAGTRSVWSCKQHSWTKHTKYYPRLFFGMSTAETLWTTRADQSRGSTIGGTNFLINLLGDPSIVPMPQTTGEPLSVSPGFDVRLSAVQGDPNLPSVDYEVQNNGTTTQKYTVKTVKPLKASVDSFSLAPGKFKKVKVSVISPEKLPTGEHTMLIQVASDSDKKQLKLIADIKAKSQIYHNNFDSPVTFTGKDRKKVELKADQTLTNGKFGAAALVNQYGAKLNTSHWGDRKSYTVSYFQNIETAGNYDVMRAGPISFLINGGKMKVWKRPSGWVYGPSPGAKIYDGPEYKTGKWQHIVVVYDRPNNTLTIHVDGKQKSHQLEYTDNIHFSSSNLELIPRGNSAIALDDLRIFNYPLSSSDLSLVTRQSFIAPTLPLENNKVNPSNVILSWNNETSKPAKLEVATDPSFRKILFTKKASKGAKVAGLRNNTRYFWRVNHPTGSSFKPSNIVRSFTTDSSVQPIKFDLKPIKLPVAGIGVSGYNKRLNPFVSGLDRDMARKITYSKLSGPNWLRIYPDGLLFTNYGPTPSDKGENKFKVKITAPDGTTHIAEFTIEAK